MAMDKHGLALLLMPKKGKEEMPEPEEDSGPSLKEIKQHKLDAMKSFMDACKNDDAEGCVEALDTLHELQHAEWDKGEYGEEEAPESEPEMPAEEEAAE